MLRLTGVLAFLLTTALLILAAVGLRSVRASGHFRNSFDPNLRALTSNWSSIHLETAGGTRNLFNADLAPGFEGGFAFVTSGDNVLDIFVPFPELPRECDVEVVYYAVDCAEKRFSSSSLRYAGNFYPIDRSPWAFFGMLGLVAFGPTLLWGVAAGLSALGSRRRSTLPPHHDE